MPRKSPNPRTSILHVRLSLAERRLLNELAKREFLTPSAWARRATLLALQSAVEAARGAPAPAQNPVEAEPHVARRGTAT